MSEQIQADPKTKPVIAGHNPWTHQLLAGLKLDHLNVLDLSLTLRPNEIATLTATIAVDVEQDDALRQAIEHKIFALLELSDDPELTIGELPATELPAAAEAAPEPAMPEPAKPKAKRRKAAAAAAA